MQKEHPKLGQALSGWKAITIFPSKSQTSNGFGFSNIPQMLFKQRYMQAAGDSASKIGLNKNNHIVLEQKIVFNW